MQGSSRHRAHLLRALAPPAPARPGALAPAALLVALSLVLGACGSSKSGTSADPAGVVPASAPAYLGAVVRPSGQLHDAASTVGQRLTQQADPYLRLLTLLHTPGSPALTFKRDVAPWLGMRAGLFLTSLGSSTQAAGTQLGALAKQLLLGTAGAAGGIPFGAAGGVQGALVMDTSDAKAARSFLATQATRAGAHAGSYRGVAYQATAGGLAFALVDNFAVIGSESGLRGVIDTSAGGAALSHQQSYTQVLATAPKEALAQLYLASGALASGARGAAAQSRAGLAALLAGTSAVGVSLTPSSTSLALDINALPAAAGAAGAGSSGGLLTTAGGGAAITSELPGDSWLAIGTGEVGTTLGALVAVLQGAGSLAGISTTSGSQASPLSLAGLLGGILEPLRILGANSPQAKRDYQSWMESGAIFASGSGLLELRAGTVIASRDPERSRAAVGKLGAALSRAGASVEPVQIPGTDAAIAAHVSGLPVELAIADGTAASGRHEFVIGLAEASVLAALHPSSTLSSAPSYAAASSALGGGIHPSLLFEPATLVSLLEGIGLSGDPTIAPFLPTLRAVGAVAGGASASAQSSLLRLVLTLRAPS